METSGDYAWAFAVVGGTLLLGLALWFGMMRSSGRQRPKEAVEATAPRSYDQPGERAAEQRERVASPPDH